jgi:hypothetical protein
MLGDIQIQGCLGPHARSTKQSTKSSLAYLDLMQPKNYVNSHSGSFREQQKENRRGLCSVQTKVFSSISIRNWLNPETQNP